MEQRENMEPYRMLLEGGEGELIEKKSRFIATIRRVESEEEAVSFIEEMKKKVLGCHSQLFRFCNRKKGGTDQMQR